MPRFNVGDTRTAQHYRDRAARLRDEADRELDDKRREQLRRIARDQEQQARNAERIRG